MTDKPELIQLRMVEVLQTIPELRNVFRDRGDMEAHVLPAAVVLDNRAQMVTEIAQLKPRGGLMPPTFFDFLPQVWIALRPRDTPANTTIDGMPAPVGTELTVIREAAITAILNDPTLLSYVAPDGYMGLEGWETDMAIGSSLVGNIMLSFRFRYVFFPPRG